MIVVVGLSHHTAPIEVRERAALTPEAQDRLVGDLVADPRVGEAFVVSTCNRVEVVAVGREASSDALGRCALACSESILRVAPDAVGHIYSRVGVDGVRHLIQVASSLDSLVVGEPQILGQLKFGYERARERGHAGPVLERAFNRAVRVAKRIRTETNIGAGQVSVPSIAVDLAVQIFGDLRSHSAVLVGTGEMGQTVARLVKDAGARLTVVGRSEEKTQAMAARLGATGRAMKDLPDVLVGADIVISSTSSELPVITRAQVAPLRKARRGRSLFFIDLAVPRDVEASIGELDGVFLYNVDDLSKVALESAEGRRKEAVRAGELAEEAVREYQRWVDGEQATPVIKSLRKKLRDSLELELSKSLRGRLKNLDADEQDALVKMIDASVNRMLHAPTVRLRQGATSGDDFEEEYARVLTHLFDLEATTGAAPSGFEAVRAVSGASEFPVVEDSAPGHELPGAGAVDSLLPKKEPTIQ